MAAFATRRSGPCFHAFVLHFFGCDDCRRHFLEEYDSCAHQRCVDVGTDANAATGEGRSGSAAGVVLWLWRAHNAVNARLYADRFAAAALESQAVALAGGAAVGVGAHPPPSETRAALWPPVSACRGCYRGRGAHVAGLCMSTTDPSCWDERMVLAYARRSYWDAAEWGELEDAEAALPPRLRGGQRQCALQLVAGMQAAGGVCTCNACISAS